MAQFIVNPRRTPRAPARCRAEVVCPQGRFEAETEDIGSMGCQVVSPKLVRKGDAVRLAITNDKVGDPLVIAGRVAWVSPQPPWRVGIAFAEESLAESARWFERLISAYPGLAGYRKVPDRIATDATVYLGPPPRFLLDFTKDEATLLRAIASGARIDELMARLRDGWPAAQRALFSLIARQAVTLQRGHAVHPATWKQILSDVEASLALESLGKEGSTLAAPLEPPRPPDRPSATPPPVARTPLPGAHPPVSRTPVPGAATPVPRAATPVPRAATPVPRAATPVPRAATPVPRAPTPVPETGAVTPAPGLYGVTARTPPPAPVGGWSGQRPHDPTRVVDLQPEDGPPLEIAAPGEGARRAGAHAPDFAGAGAGWRRARARSPEAQAVFDRALAEIQAANVNAAIALLRQALSLAPGDPEIAQQLGRLAFQDRTPGGR